MDKKKLIKATILLLPLLALSGCIGGQGGGFDLNAFLKHPVVMVVIGLVVLWFAFSHSKH